VVQQKSLKIMAAMCYHAFITALWQIIFTPLL